MSTPPDRVYNASICLICIDCHQDRMRYIRAAELLLQPRHIVRPVSQFPQPVVNRPAVVQGLCLPILAPASILTMIIRPPIPCYRIIIIAGVYRTIRSPGQQPAQPSSFKPHPIIIHPPTLAAPANHTFINIQPTTQVPAPPRQSTIIHAPPKATQERITFRVDLAN